MQSSSRDTRNTTIDEKQVVIYQQCNAIREVMNSRHITLRERVALKEIKGLALERLVQVLESVRYELLKVQLRELQAQKWIEETK